jgi:hypothetical protein
MKRDKRGIHKCEAQPFKNGDDPARREPGCNRASGTGSNAEAAAV